MNSGLALTWSVCQVLFIFIYIIIIINMQIKTKSMNTVLLLL